MKEHHAFFLSSLLFASSAIFAADSNSALMAVFIVLAGACTTLGILRIAQDEKEERED